MSIFMYFTITITLLLLQLSVNFFKSLPSDLQHILSFSSNFSNMQLLQEHIELVCCGTFSRIFHIQKRTAILLIIITLHPRPLTRLSRFVSFSISNWIIWIKSDIRTYFLSKVVLTIDGKITSWQILISIRTEMK